MRYIVEHEGPLALFKGIGPQLMKGLMVQGLLMMTKERVEILFLMFFAYLRTVREKRLKAVAEKLKANAAPVANDLKSRTMPAAEAILDKAKGALPVSSK